MTHRDEDEEIIDSALDTLAWQRREIDRLTKGLHQIYVDAIEQHTDWCDMGPVEDEARDWAFSIAVNARNAMRGEQ